MKSVNLFNVFFSFSDDKLTTLFSISLLNLLQAKIEKEMNVNMNIFTILSRISISPSPEPIQTFNNPNETDHETYFEKVFNYVRYMNLLEIIFLDYRF